MSKVDQVAELLFAKFRQDFPLADNKGAAKAIRNLPQKTIEQRLGQFYEEAREERRKHRLWVIGWARVVMKLQQRLLLAGYPPEMVSKLLLAMMFASYRAN